ncbi:MAG: Beta-galactosidase BoGH2A [Candidatus Ordinivivax streblomastigis]|uniref:Beta-galactosidase BoGH2A n=1 Tax=Candidatus Ordinivivax streblomastigis TaxID=2540710 RepID=A0A5M8P2M1_9BACT|nr:MAG: Beta-galactosidase BoGH2A [Candidatus Ordinivivax streblomastigis]
MKSLHKLSLSLFAVLMLQTSYANDRLKINIGEGWKFSKTTADASSTAYDDASWATVTIPHTWNATDAQDGGGNYFRGIGWYRKSLLWDAAYAGKSVYIEVLAASLQAEVFVNGVSQGVHKGGYNAFRFDLTGKLSTTGDNKIAIKVDNRTIDDIAPLSGDFSVIGGIYRKIFLIVADPVHVDLKDSGANGLYLTTSEVSTASAKLEVKTTVVNESNVAKTVNLKAVVKNPDTFEGIDEVPNPIFNTAALAPGGTIATLEENTITIPAGDSYEFKEEITVANPHLWNGKVDPYRYLVDFTVTDGSTVVDAVSDYVGFRFFRADNNGFYLNGNLYPLRGVNRHQDWKDKGYAISDSMHNVDFGMIYEIGANAIRLAHYPQDPYFHELFDKYGIVVWVEIPFVDKFGSNKANFVATTKIQLREMIRQRYNRPSILMWGLQNEVSTGSYNTEMSVIVPELHAFAKAEDPSRLTVQAQAGSDQSGWTTDLFAKNQYPGWYQSGSFGSYMDNYKNKHSINGVYHPVGMSEYGAGGNPTQHEVYTKIPNVSVTTTGAFHSEEYQSAVHQQAIKDISTRSWIWGTFVWNMFDFASDSRNEGSQPGINDKGLVTHDRKIKKDSFYAYKVNWSNEPTVYIASRRFTERTADKAPVTVYTNGESVEVFLNGISQGVKNRTVDNCGILSWDDLLLTNKGMQGSSASENTIVAKSTINSVEYTDTVKWNRIISNSTDLTSTVVMIDNVNKTIYFSSTIKAEAVSLRILGVSGATVQVMQADGTTPVPSGNVTAGMKLIVTAEDGVTTAVYTFLSMKHLALNKPVTASKQENTTNTPVKAVDGDNTTRWSSGENASASAPHWLEVDLGKEYFISQVNVLWFDSETNHRAYQYQVLGKQQGATTYTTLADKTNNTTLGLVTSTVANKPARSIKINVTGSAQNASYNYPSIYELMVYGWRIESTVYTIDYAHKTIFVPFTGNNIEHPTFLSNITFLGQESHSIASNAYYITDGDKLEITDSNDAKTEFTIHIVQGRGINHLTSSSKVFTVGNTGETVCIHLNDWTKAKLEINDIAGKQIVNKEIQSNEKLSLAKGLYIISVSTEDLEKSTIKYLVQ